jgi:peptide/nickel transport system substrate-binding protein
MVDEWGTASAAEDDRFARKTLLQRAALVGLSLPAAQALVMAADARAAVRQAGTTQAAGGTLRFARNFEPSTFDPFGSADNGSIFIRVQLFDTLVEARPNTTKPVLPALAESYTESKDGKTWTFKLRDAQFSNGDPVTAEDVRFSLVRFLDPKLNVNLPSLAYGIDKVVAVDKKTVKVTLKHPVGAFLINVSVFPASILNKKQFLKLGKKYFDKPIGTGPFIVQEWVRGSHIILTRNPHYWVKGQPLLDSIRFDYIADDNARMLKIRSGAADIAEGVPFKQIKSLRGQSGFKVLVEPIVRYESVFLNHRYAPFSDINVRKALNLATDKDAINQAVYGGVGVPANDIIPRTTFFADNKQLPPYAYDLKQAKALMAKSKTPTGFKASFMYPAGSTVHKDLATILQALWGQIGVQLTLQEIEGGALFSKYESKNWQVAVPLVQFTSDVNVPDEVASLFYDPSPSNAISAFITGWKMPPQLWTMTQEALNATSDAQRAVLWPKVQKLALDQAPWVPLFFLPAVTAVSNKVQNFKTLPNGWWDLQFTSVAK